MPKILIKRKAEVFQEYTIPSDKASITVGAEADNDLMIEDKKVSMNHLQVLHEGNQYYIKDLRSAFGTFLNGQLIEEMTPVKHGDAIQIGQHSLIFLEDEALAGDEVNNLNFENSNESMVETLTSEELNLEQDLLRTQQELENIQASSFNFDLDSFEADATPTPQPAGINQTRDDTEPHPETLEKTNYYLLAIYGPYLGKKYQLNRQETKIGRDTKLNDIIIRFDNKGNVDPSVSRRHATIRYQNGTFFISDKRSKTRTFVNQNKLSETDQHQLFVGDEIEIVSDQQSTIFRFCTEDNLDFSPPKKAGVWWVRYRWPIIRGISALILLLTIIVFTKALSKRAILTQKPSTLSLTESVWFKSNQQVDELNFDTYRQSENFTNTPVLGDLNLDGYVDIAFLDHQGRIRAISGETRRPLWETEPYIRAQTPGQLVLADINRDAIKDIIMFSVTERLMALDGKLGLEIWSSSIIGGGLAGSPVVADINGDDRNDVGACTRDGRFIVALGTSTEPTWHFIEVGDSMLCTPSAGDVTGDGIDEFLFGTEAGEIWIYQEKAKKAIAQININDEIGSALGTFNDTNRIRCPISIGLLNSDSRHDLIVSSNQGNLLALNGLNKQRLWFDSSTPEGDFITDLYFPVTTGDFDADHRDDAVMFTYDGRIRAFKGASNTGTHKIVLWEFPPEDWEKYIANPVLADMNKDGTLDVIAAGVNHGLYIINGLNGNTLWKSEFNGKNPVITAPVVADLNDDSYLDILIMRSDRQIYQYTSNVRYPRSSIIWEQRFSNARHNGHSQVITFSTTSYNFQIIISLIIFIGLLGINFYWFHQQKSFMKNKAASI